MGKLRLNTAEAKAKRLTNLYLKTGSQKRVAELEGVTKQAISQRFAREPVKKALQSIIDENLKKAGISATKVYKRLNEQLDATKVISAVVVNQKNRPTSLADGELFDANEKTNDFIDVPDNQARDKAIDKCLMLLGHIKQQQNGKNGNGDINIGLFDFGQINSEARRELITIIRKRRSESEPV